MAHPHHMHNDILVVSFVLLFVNLCKQICVDCSLLSEGEWVGKDLYLFHIIVFASCVLFLNGPLHSLLGEMKDLLFMPVLQNIKVHLVCFTS